MIASQEQQREYLRMTLKNALRSIQMKRKHAARQDLTAVMALACMRYGNVSLLAVWALRKFDEVMTEE